MKINNMPVQTQHKAQSAENANAAGKGAVAEPKERVDDSAVVLSVSQRNSVSVSGEGPEIDKGSFSDMLKALASNPESTSQLHANLSPERVLKLLA